MFALLDPDQETDASPVRLLLRPGSAVSAVSSAVIRPSLSATRGPHFERASRYLVLLSAATLFLHDAATVGVSYTLRVSYGLMALACVVGFRFVISGWRSAPDGVKLAGAFLLVVYILSGLLGVNPVLTGQGRASHTRWIVYVLDLGLGMASMGLLLGLFRDRVQVRRLVYALAIGGVIAAVYGLYQWFAQRHGWPFSNLDNAPNSDNFTMGARFQGLGLLGWERVRGTFVEPFAFGIYLAAVLPLAALLFPGRSHWMRAAKVGAVSLMGLALLLTDSSLAWATLLVAVAIGATGVCISAGRPALAGVAGGGVALLAVLCVVTVAEPGFLSNLTARSNSQLHLTLNARTDAWESATHIWSQRPVLGYGPGASSVKLARRDNAVGVSSEPTVLGSAYGVWSASLIDAGVLGLLAWVVMFGAVAYYAGSVAMRQRSVFLWSVIAALTAGIIASQVGGDRLDLRVWLLMGLAVVASRRVANHPIGQERRI